MMRIAAALILTPLLLAAPLTWSAMYSTGEIAADRTRLANRITELRGLLTSPQFLPETLEGVADIPLLTPDVAPNGDPMGFLAYEGKVYMPIAGLKFIEDLTMAYAWRYRRGQTLEPLDEYLAMLRWKPEEKWPAGVFLNPLEAFGLPVGAWERDKELAELGTSLRNEAWAFVLAHELAHVVYRHPGNNAPSGISQANEAQADAFAMELMERSDTTPMGAFLYFQATVAFYASRADFESDAEYALWQREKASHPVNSQRLLAMSRQLQLWSRRVTNKARKETLFFMGDRLEQFAQQLADPAMQQLIARRAVFDDPRDLKER